MCRDHRPTPPGAFKEPRGCLGQRCTTCLGSAEDKALILMSEASFIVSYAMRFLQQMQSRWSVSASARQLGGKLNAQYHIPRAVTARVAGQQIRRSK